MRRRRRGSERCGHRQGAGWREREEPGRVLRESLRGELGLADSSLLDPDFRNRERINGCCHKPPSSW